MRPFTWPIALFGWVVGTAHAAEFLDDSYKALSPNQLDSVVLEVAKIVRDPTALIFKGMVHPDTGSQSVDKTVVCGFVNGRNAYGAYAGFTPFVYQGPIFGSEPLVTLDIALPNDDFGDALHKHIMKQTGCAAVLGL